MTTTLPNGVRLSDHHPYGRTWHQFILEQVAKDEAQEEKPDYILCSRTDDYPRRTFRQILAPFNPMNV